MVKNSAVVYKIPAGTFEIEGGIHLVFIKFSDRSRFFKNYDQKSKRLQLLLFHLYQIRIIIFITL